MGRFCRPDADLLRLQDMASNDCSTSRSIAAAAAVSGGQLERQFLMRWIAFTKLRRRIKAAGESLRESTNQLLLLQLIEST